MYDVEETGASIPTFFQIACVTFSKSFLTFLWHLLQSLGVQLTITIDNLINFNHLNRVINETPKAREWEN